MAAGGGLYLSDGTVNLLSSKVFGNSARGGNGGAGGDATGGGGNGGNGGAGQPGLGGGLFVSAGTLNLSTSVVSGNHASGGGGGNGGNATGISGFGGFAGGGNQGAGGGLYAGSGSVNLSTSTVYNNRAGGGAGGCGGSCNFPGCRGYSGGGGDGAGGGLFVNGGTLSLWRSTDGQNVAAGADAGCPSAPAFTGGGGGSSRGGGMFASGEGVGVINSTFYGNTADRGGSGAGFSSPGNPGDSEGGGLFVEAGSINLAGVTIASNHTEAGGGSRAIRGSSLGGGICQLGSAPQVRSDSTLIGDNSTQGDGPDVSGQISLSFSLISNTAGASITDGGHNLFDVEPVLDPGGLRTIWGGPTQTVALQSPSPAIDHGDNTICRMARPTGLASVDQRGFSRIRHGDLLCDIGAFEFTTLVVLPSYLYFGFEAVSEQTAVQTATVREAAVGGVTLTESIGGANPGDFVQTANSCGTTLRDGYTCSISIAFKPTTTGSRSALLTVSDSPDRTSPYQIQLVGIGQ